MRPVRRRSHLVSLGVGPSFPLAVQTLFVGLSLRQICLGIPAPPARLFGLAPQRGLF
jgi:hypothetical protein